MTYRQDINCASAPDETRTLRAQCLAMIPENSSTRIAYALAELGLDAISLEQFQVRHPGLDPVSCLDDPQVANLVEAISGRSGIQEAALHAQLQRALRKSVSTLDKRLNDETCSVTVAKDIGETLVRVGNMLDRRDGGGSPDTNRHLQLLVGMAYVVTPEGRSQFSANTPSNIPRIVRAMRCTTEAEVNAVVDLLSRSLMRGELVLEGW